MRNLSDKKIASKILFLAGLAVSLFGLTIIKDAVKCLLYWEKTDCVIIGAYVRDLPVPEAKMRRNLTPDVIYEYKTSSGEEYFSNKLSYVDIKIFPQISDNYYAGNFDEVKDFISQFQHGTKFHAFYNPQKPSEAVLDNSLKLPIFIPFLIGLAMIYASLHFHIFSYIAPKNKK